MVHLLGSLIGLRVLLLFHQRLFQHSWACTWHVHSHRCEPTFILLDQLDMPHFPDGELRAAHIVLSHRLDPWKKP